MASTNAKQMQKLSAVLQSLSQQAQTKSKKISPSSRRARRLRRAARASAGTVMNGSAGNSSGRFESLPVSRAYGNYNLNKFVVKNTKHRLHGEGILVHGCESLADITTAAAASDFFANSVGTVGSVNMIRLSPDTFNGRLALQARSYARYRFTRLRLTFVPSRGTANPGMAAIGYVPDGAQTVYATTDFASTTQMNPSMVFSLNYPSSLECLEGRPIDDELYYVELDVTAAQAARQTVQGQIIGYPSSNGLGAISHGLLIAEYECELFYPTTDYGFTVTVRDVSERDQVRRILEKIRLEEDEWEKSSKVAGGRRRD